MGYFLPQEYILDVLENLTEQHRVYAPVRQDDVVSFSSVRSGESVCLEYDNSTVPPKHIIFPQTEVLFRYSQGDEYHIDAAELPQSVVVFGVRPCDAKGLTILDQVFNDAITDTYYARRREMATIIGLACTRPCENCFCTSVQGGPANADGMDLLLTPVDNGYMTRVLTEKGQALFDSVNHLWQTSTDEQRTQETDIAARAVQRIVRHVDTTPFPEKLNSLFYDDIWRELSQACIGCSICTFLCPTCHCFDIRDEAGLQTVKSGQQTGKRVRMWDTCSNPEYTQHASGHNPRPGRLHRTRNRIFHKYTYHPQRFGEFACVGCGRCISKCPVNIDILDILTKIAAL